MTRVVEAVERAKIALSDKDEVRLFDPFLTGEGEGAVHLDLALTRADVEDVARPFVARTLEHIDAALRDAGVLARDTHRILLVGGSSKMPLVRRMIAAHLARPVHVDLDADRAVALGASLLAARIGGADIDEVLVDITPHTLSVGTADEDFLEGETSDLVAHAVIPGTPSSPWSGAGRSTPSSKTSSPPSCPSGRASARACPATPSSAWCASSRCRRAPGAPVEVTFRLDLSGVLHVRALHVPSGRSADVHIAESPYRLTEQVRRSAGAEVAAMRAQAPEAAEGPERERSLPRARDARPSRACARQGGRRRGEPRARERGSDGALGGDRGERPGADGPKRRALGRAPGSDLTAPSRGARPRRRPPPSPNHARNADAPPRFMT